MARVLIPAMKLPTTSQVMKATPIKAVSSSKVFHITSKLYQMTFKEGVLCTFLTFLYEGFFLQGSLEG